MSQEAVLIAVFLAVVIGWCLGRFSGRSRDKQKFSSIPSEYFKGLNYLLNEQPDKAIDVFIQALEVNSDTVETHLSLGKLFRKRGEVDKAILVHQNLLARPNLARGQQEQVQLELARDYFAAGVFDRAERLLQDLIDRGCSCRSECQNLLLTIFEQEKDWSNAIVVAEQLAIVDKQLEKSLAHYCCEMALGAMESGEWNAARRTLKRALGYDKQCVRASLLSADLERSLSNYKEAIRHYRRIRHQNADYLPEILGGLQQCYEALGNPEEYTRYLRKCLEETPVASVAIALANRLRDELGDIEATQVISRFVKAHPSVKGVKHLLDFSLNRLGDDAKEDVVLMRETVQEYLEKRPVYHCESCGFSGKKLHWQCPSCHTWGSVKPIVGLEGE